MKRDDSYIQQLYCFTSLQVNVCSIDESLRVGSIATFAVQQFDQCCVSYLRLLCGYRTWLGRLTLPSLGTAVRHHFSATKCVVVRLYLINLAMLWLTLHLYQ